MKIHLETSRLILRPIVETDAQDFFELDSNPNVHKYLGNNPVKSLDQCGQVIASILKQYKLYGLGRLAVTDKSSGDFLGWSGLKFEQQVRREFSYYDLGYRFKEQYWGQGYATEAALASIDYGFKNLNLSEINAAADTDHAVSNHILNKIGMTFSGTFIFEGATCNWYSLKNPTL